MQLTEDFPCSFSDRPWLVDCLDEWLERLEGEPHKKAAIFIDNSGVDVVLGILPFTRWLCSRGTKVCFVRLVTFCL